MLDLLKEFVRDVSQCTIARMKQLSLNHYRSYVLFTSCVAALKAIHAQPLYFVGHFRELETVFRTPEFTAISPWRDHIKGDCKMKNTTMSCEIQTLKFLFCKVDHNTGRWLQFADISVKREDQNDIVI